VSRKFFVAKLASCPPLRASVLEVVFHQHPGDLSSALASARDGVVFAGVQVGL